MGNFRTLAGASGEVRLEVGPPLTIRSVRGALEAAYPVLRGTICNHDTAKRRAFMRFFACRKDLSHEAPDSPLPVDVAQGKEPLLVIGAIAGG